MGLYGAQVDTNPFPMTPLLIQKHNSFKECIKYICRGLISVHYNNILNDDINIITYEQMYKGNVMLQVLEDFSKNWGAVIVISTPNKKEAIHYAIASCVDNRDAFVIFMDFYGYYIISFVGVK